MNKYFPSARSTVLGLILWGTLLVVFILSMNEALKSSKLTDVLILLTFWILMLLFVGVVWFRTRYYISDRQLIVKIGPIAHSRIDISTISEISKTKSWLSAPANSLNRLAIKSRDKMLVMVSPEDQKGFIESLKAINPDIKFEA